MLKRIRICDRCGKELKNEEEIKYMIDYRYRFEICDECYEAIK